MKNNKYYILWGFIFLSFLSLVLFKTDIENLVSKVWANPDYICIKDITSWCTYTANDCTDWSNQKRTCVGKTVTQVAYYSVRIGCAEWWVWRVVWSAWWASGRRTADQVRHTESCTVVEEDKEAPSWSPDTIYQ